MNVQTLITGVSDFVPFEEQRGPIITGYTKANFSGERYPVVLQLSESAYGQILDTVANGFTSAVSIEVWAKPYTARDGSNRASLATKLVSIN